jgi:hypothetical protein
LGMWLIFPFTDETKPKCLRCRNSGHDCTGYPERSNFIDDSPLHRRRRMPRNVEPGTRAIAVVQVPREAMSILGEDVYFGFLEQHLRTASPILDVRWPGFYALDMSDCLPRRCLKSFAASFYGRRHALLDTQEEGLQLYTTSLRELNGRLQQPRQSPPSSTIMAIAILTLCEVGLLKDSRPLPYRAHHNADLSSSV